MAGALKPIDDGSRSIRVMASMIGVSADQLCLAFKWHWRNEGEYSPPSRVTERDARYVWREWNDRPVMPVRLKRPYGVRSKGE